MTVDTSQAIPKFDPEGGVTILEPPSTGRGAWNGAHTVIYDEDREAFLMYYRMRNPMDWEAAARRGAGAFIAQSADGIRFETVWSADKSQFNATSIEKGTLVRAPGGGYLLYISYDHADAKAWQIDVMAADRPEDFDPARRRPFLTPQDVAAINVKDPFAAVEDGVLHVFANYSFEYGREATLVATTSDGFTVDAVENLFSVGDAGHWDSFGSRLTSILPLDRHYYAFYDGAATLQEVCEESCGVFRSEHLTHGYERLTVDGPLLPGVRYVHALAHGDAIYLYYEYTRPDGSHELRLNIVT